MIIPMFLLEIQVGTYPHRMDGNDINLTKKIASPYATLKNYVPDQYGKKGHDEIKWLSLNHNILFNKESKNIFGGDIFISRVDLKK